MFQLNPLDLPGAWWQHLLMLLISGIIGYVIGFRSRNGVVSDLEGRLERTEIDFEKCSNSLSAATSPVKTGSQVIDDFKIIEGIGPRIEKLLHNAGIQTYTQLSSTSSSKIRQILTSVDSRFQINDPETWPRQAFLAASGNWNELKQLQDTLDGGKA